MIRRPRTRYSPPDSRRLTQPAPVVAPTRKKGIAQYAVPAGVAAAVLYGLWRFTR